ncbi:low molecular weight phosphatase family protein [Ornithinimicrobium tianjinense]|uniref:protein-tyrosine-phosphatase n=1 Tax=Ornithinimicrobium tianjinense TaxID=1195761 RepID=A0A917BDX4_9MICO|nr:low molecular weight phosphatase family protein [Ornithinimicrobium tianjinense]GGF39332.1 low molecular weight phosphatase family protein [Ornithinimicrobium tianjinense]
MEQGLILVVCTGNVCRSPLVERVLQAGLDQRHGPGSVLVRSAGTSGLEGWPMDERSAALLADLGGSADGFAARRLTPEMVAAAELVLTATRDHRARSVRLHPRALRRTFTVRELADILSRVPEEELPTAADPAERLRELVRVAGDHRGLHLPDRPEDHDLVDPFRREDSVYAQLREELLPALPHLRRGLGL